MHPALRKGPLFYKKKPIFHFFTTPHFPFFLQKKTIFHIFYNKNTHTISFPAYGPASVGIKQYCLVLIIEQCWA